ncbi:MULTISPECIES: hypothetical protein [Streptomyces]|uniref:hypothetical protein n=1 Tax=Streptomyces TaxID=1883 RepID=UPI0002E9ACC7|nr:MULTISPECIES: hypothetical protein [Streptomyces]
MVEVPTGLFEHLSEDALPAGEFKRLEEPLMILTPTGAYAAQGAEVVDAEALEQMEIPDYETVVEVPQDRDHRPTGGTAWS